MNHQLARMSQPSNLDETFRVGEVLAKSGFFDDSRQAAQAVTKIMAGQELGLSPIASMTGINIIKGRVSIGANLIASVIKRSRPEYDYKVVELTDAVCSIDFYERGELAGNSTFTKEDAAKAQTQNMGKFARNMLFARAMSNGARWYTPAIFGGPVYTPDELGATVDAEGQVIDVPAEPRQIAPPAQASARLVTRVRQLEAEVLVLDPEFDIALNADLNVWTEEAVIAYGQEIKNHIAFIRAQEQPEPQPTILQQQAAITDAQKEFWHAWGGVVGGTTWAHVQRNLGPLPEPRTDEEWNEMDARMTAHNWEVDAVEA